ncbi:MAG: PBS lyase [Chloroflexi bacterium]|nr:MAG: DUF1186 domain-containing protein [Chloroflexota bacterium]MCQ3936438.1 PBS lyase [Chloroflexota bacterium]MDL1910018.1 DUF1186 domain-containing protein [Chloroflexi bacterium CFX6]
MAYTFPKDFSAPVLALVSLGEKSARVSEWHNYLELGITDEHTPELIRILDDIESFWPDEDVSNAPESYAPIHAWRALGQLKAEQAIPSLVRLIVWNEDENADWLMEDIPEVLGMIGPASIPPLRDYLLKPDKFKWASVTMSHGLAEIGKQNPEYRSACVEALQAALERYAENGETINAFLIDYLAELKAVEAAPLVERAYQADAVDISVLGDFEDFQILVGLLKKRLTPPPRFYWAKDPKLAWESEKATRREEGRRQRDQEKKEKKKQKQAKKARRKHKKK